MNIPDFIHPEDAATLKTLQVDLLSLLSLNKRYFSIIQIEQVRELLAEISLLVAARGIFDRQETPAKYA